MMFLLSFTWYRYHISNYIETRFDIENILDEWKATFVVLIYQKEELTLTFPISFPFFRRGSCEVAQSATSMFAIVFAIVSSCMQRRRNLSRMEFSFKLWQPTYLGAGFQEFFPSDQTVAVEIEFLLSSGHCYCVHYVSLHIYQLCLG